MIIDCTCTEVCVMKIGCHTHTTHTHTHYSQYTVVRVQLDFGLSSDVNECQLGTDICVNANCNNTDGSYTCTCLPGFIPQNLTTCSKFPCTCLMQEVNLGIALHQMILGACFTYISQIAQMATSG